MVERRTVTRARRDPEGDILSVANPAERWYERTVAEVVADIEGGDLGYLVEVDDAPSAEIIVVEVDGRKHLRTKADLSGANNLDNLSSHVVPTHERLAELAPQLRLHPDEEYMPMDALEFVRLSRFRHHRGGQRDEGYNKRTGQWVVSNAHSSEYYDIPVAFIDSYGPHADGRNRRPRDDHSGDEWNVFLEPRGKPKGAADPNGEVPCFVHARDLGRHAGHSVAIAQYWFFFGYNDGWASFNHQGDWEHVALVMHENEAVGAYFAAHGSPSYHPRSELQWVGEHLVVYSAKGSHASYPRAGSFHTAKVDKTADGGVVWRTWTKLEQLADQPWRNFAGAWGEVGALATTTGPLGPWHKRDKEGLP